MRILQVIEALTRGGAERLTLELAGEYKRQENESSVLCLSSRGEWASRIEGTPLYLGCVGKKPGFDWRAASRLRKTIDSYAPDVVQSHLYTANLWARLAALPSRKWALVATLHNVDTWRGPAHVLADRLLSHVPDHYVGVSRAVAEYYRGCGLGSDRLRMIPNGVGANGFQPSEPFRGDAVVVRACGRLVPNKGFDVFIDAAALLRNRGVSAVFEIVGEGPERPALEGRIAANGLDGVVKLLGDSPDARGLIATADIFVLSSVMEGLPLVVLEALHAGRPVVVTDLAGLEGVVADGETGVVVPPRDAGAIAGALERLIGDPEEARRLGRAGRAYAEKELSIERTASSYLELYSEILSVRAR